MMHGPANVKLRKEVSLSKKKDRHYSQWRIQYDNLTMHVQLKVFKTLTFLAFHYCEFLERSRARAWVSLLQSTKENITLSLYIRLVLI